RRWCCSASTPWAAPPRTEPDGFCRRQWSIESQPSGGSACAKVSMVRGLIKAGLASAVCASRADRVIGALTRHRRVPVVFGYHRIVDDFAAHAAFSIPPMLTSRRMFERHLDWIATRFDIVGLEELESRHRRARPAAVITFDDGYRDVYEQAFPLLVRKGI